METSTSRGCRHLGFAMCTPSFEYAKPSPANNESTVIRMFEPRNLDECMNCSIIDTGHIIKTLLQHPAIHTNCQILSHGTLIDLAISWGLIKSI